MKGSTTLAFALVQFSTASQLVWPSKWDELENLYYMQHGINKRGFADAVTPCSFGQNEPGRQNSAEWLRTAFHDVITHDAKAGTGGLDASIYWESKRPENPGRAFENTFSFFSSFHTPRTTASDLTALGTVVAVGMCGGPTIPFRPGRVDAYKAGPSGVPEPSTNLKDTFSAFTKAGFTKEEMTAMVACGHAIGGVHSDDFPELVGIKADPNNDTSVPFQKDVSSFHNGVVTEYLAGTSKNPLVVAKNATFHSDKRIFDNDKATMKKLATKAGFNSMCASILTRMIDTVPKSVQLGPVLEAYDVRPYIDELSLNTKGRIHWTGSIRLRITNGVRNYKDLQVNLIYAGRDGKNITVPAQIVTFLEGTTNGGPETFINFNYDTTIDAKNGITKFWIQEIKPSTKATVIHDNQKTGGYKVDDTVLYQLQQSCAGLDTLPKAPLVVTAMVRDARAKDPMTLRVAHKKYTKVSPVPKFQTEIVNFKATGKKSAGYTAFQAKTTYEEQNTIFDIVLGGKPASGVPFLTTQAMPEKCS
ncbi:peroxidase [Fusarium mundagurra]|uniref:Peroxidase n=1 Tax=Fusarium mundagurra TaxID=1567541 RepID=A0A8H6DNS5_9HYPO|nr:peroxidase [Fusarium mundagurra]